MLHPFTLILFESLLDAGILKQSIIHFSPHDFCSGFALRPQFAAN